MLTNKSSARKSSHKRRVAGGIGDNGSPLINQISRETPPTINDSNLRDSTIFQNASLRGVAIQEERKTGDANDVQMMSIGTNLRLEHLEE